MRAAQLFLEAVSESPLIRAALVFFARLRTSVYAALAKKPTVAAAKAAIPKQPWIANIHKEVPMFHQKFISPRFWAAIAGALFIVLQLFGVRIPAPVVNELLACVSAVLVLLGFMPKKDNKSNGNDNGGTDEETEETQENSDGNNKK